MTMRAKIGVASGILVLGLGLGVTALAGERPPVRHRPPEKPSVFRPAADVQITRNGVKAVVKAFTLPGTEAVLVPMEPGPAPSKLFEDMVAKSKAPFTCTSHACAFTRMPIYNQVNPNLAFVDVPVELYGREKHPVGGPIAWEDASGHYTLKINITIDKPIADPFYASWLPLGPEAPDPASIGGQFVSDLCGETSQAMVLMAALSTRSATTKIKLDSWLQRSLLEARRPKDQTPFPSPLRNDSSLDPDPSVRQMTVEDLQRLVNTAVQLGGDPTSGTSDDKIDAEALLKDLVGAGPKHSAPYDVKRGWYPRTEDVIDMIRKGYVPMIHMGHYTSEIEPVKDSKGKVTAHKVVLTRHGGHYVAVSGFHDSALVIHDPWHGRRYTKTFKPLPIKGARAKDGTPLKVTAYHNSVTLILPDEWPAWNEASADLMSIKDSTVVLKLVEDYIALRVD